MGEYVSTSSATYAMKGGVTDYTPSFYWMVHDKDSGKKNSWERLGEEDTYLKLKAKEESKGMVEKKADYVLVGSLEEYSSAFKRLLGIKEAKYKS